MSGGEPVKQLRRSTNRFIAGVLGGVAEYLGLDPTLVRIAFVAIAIFAPFPAIVFYIIATLIVPSGPQTVQLSVPTGIVLLIGAILIALGGIASLGIAVGELVRFLLGERMFLTAATVPLTLIGLGLLLIILAFVAKRR
ncbi:MAG: PspC domain-containing protein [Thaumarchaeota archaeon]|nr:PspC domain-containing protein [Nitrososphaerota archaeon]